MRAVYAIKSSCRVHARKQLMNAIGVSHLHYSALPMAEIKLYPVIAPGKQLNWAKNVLPQKKKRDTSQDL